MLHPNNTKLLSLTLELPLNQSIVTYIVRLSWWQSARLVDCDTLMHSLPIPAQCRELDLNTDVFSRFHVYDRSVAIRGPYTIRHSEDRP